MQGKAQVAQVFNLCTTFSATRETCPIGNYPEASILLPGAA